MASKLQYTYRSSASMPDEMVEYIKTGVENAGSFPKFVDALVAEHMESGKEVDVSSIPSYEPSAAVAKVDLSGVENKIDETRKEILAAILQQVKIDAEPVREPTPVQAASGLSGEISRNDLVSLRRAMASDVIKAKDEEIEKLDELLGAIETIKIQLAELPKTTAPAPIENKATISEDYDPAFVEQVNRFFEEGQDQEPQERLDEEEAYIEDLTGLPFDDDDFAHGIKDLIGFEYIAPVEEAPVVKPVATMPPISETPEIAQIARTAEVASDDYAKEDEEYEYDEDTLLGAQVLLGLA